MDRLPGPILTTERLVLQTPRLPDVPGLYRWTRDPAVMRYLSWPRPNSTRDTTEFVQSARADQRRGVALHYVLRHQQTRRPIGCCGAHHVDTAQHASAEVGYWLARPYWGQGLMCEALATFFAHLFQSLDLHRLYAQTFVKNVRSAALLERFGFEFEGTLRHSVRRQGRLFDVHQYGLLRTDRPARLLLRSS